MKEYKTQHLFTQARANILAATPRPLPKQLTPQPWSRRTVGGLSFECPYDFERSVTIGMSYLQKRGNLSSGRMPTVSKRDCDEPWAVWWEADLKKGEHTGTGGKKLAGLLKPFGIRSPDDSRRG